MIEAARDSRVSPRTWMGIFLDIVTLFALSAVIYIALVLIAFLAEIPIEGWSVMGDRVAWCYEVIQQGHADLLVQRLLIGRPLSPVTPHVKYGFLLVSMLWPEISGVAAVCALARLRAGINWRDALAWHRWSVRKSGLIFIILLVVALAFNFGLGLLTSPSGQGSGETLPPIGLAYVLIDAFESIVLAAFMEELVIRGWLYTALRAKLSAWSTIIITALLFSGAHLGLSVGWALSVLPLGLAAGYLRERTGSVKATITFHILHNCVAYGASLLH